MIEELSPFRLFLLELDGTAPNRCHPSLRFCSTAILHRPHSLCIFAAKRVYGSLCVLPQVTCYSPKS